MTQEKHSQAIEDYVKVIYDLTCEHGRASTNQIAEAMEVKPASVTGMIKKLAVAESALVDYQKHHGVSLTSTGERLALSIMRRHRLLEQFLHEILGFEWDEVHEEAHHLEHVISEKFVERMAVVLGNPRYDPHGSPIPTRDLKIPEMTKLTLQAVEAGKSVVVKRVPDDDAALLRYLGEKGIVPDAHLSVLEVLPFDGNMKFQIENQPEPLVLGANITAEIFVEMQ